MKSIPISEDIRIADPTRAARELGLVYVTGAEPGIQRKRAGKGFTYKDAQGRTIRDTKEQARFKALVIPPAWTEVWICAQPNGHIQATGRDVKGRKQYRYHLAWRAHCDQTKFHRTMAFGQVLPDVRQQTSQALSLPGLPREKVLATVLQLLDKTGMRVGNEEYVKANQSFGLTTMRDEHVDISGGKMRFEFRGKSGQEQAFDLRDPRLARIVKRCQDLPGEELFQYLDDAGQQQRIGSQDVNEYLRALTCQDFTAKDFRTWTGTVQAAVALQENGAFETLTEAKRKICQAIKATAERLGNKPATCRKYYVHPGILDAYLQGTLLETLESQTAQKSKAPAGLSPEEKAVMSLLSQVTQAKSQKRERKPQKADAPLQRAS